MTSDDRLIRRHAFRAAAPHPYGLNVVGFLDAESGLGEVARRIASSLNDNHVPAFAISHRETVGRQQHPGAIPLAVKATYDTNLVCANPRHLPGLIAGIGSAFFANRYSIGLWFWETDRLRADDARAVRFFDELWVTSSYVRDAVAPAVDVPVEVLPVPMVPPPGPFRSRAALGLPESFVFLFVFDFWSEPRKNPLAAVDAFMRAFAPGEGPVLVLKSINGRAKPRYLERLRAMIGARRDIVLRDGYVSPGERDSYFAACDCYVSLHRSEGLGLTMAEAMVLGKPVIATAYSGNLEFLDGGNGYLVPCELVDVPEDWWAHAPGAQWAEPDVEAAAAHMRRVWEHRDEAEAVGERARREVVERFSPERTVDFVERRLREVHATGAVASRASCRDARPALLDATLALESDGGRLLTDASGLRATNLVRRVLGRALWPYLQADRHLEATVVEAVTSLERSVRELERRVRDLEASRAVEGAAADESPKTTQP